MYKHPCIKCRAEYEDDDPEPYYCPTCLEEKKRIAAEIDKTIRPSKEVTSALAEYDNAPKVNGFMIIKS